MPRSDRVSRDFDGKVNGKAIHRGVDVRSARARAHIGYTVYVRYRRYTFDTREARKRRGSAVSEGGYNNTSRHGHIGIDLLGEDDVTHVTYVAHVTCVTHVTHVSHATHVTARTLGASFSEKKTYRSATDSGDEMSGTKSACVMIALVVTRGIGIVVTVSNSNCNSNRGSHTVEVVTIIEMVIVKVIVIVNR